MPWHEWKLRMLDHIETVLRHCLVSTNWTYLHLKWALGRTQCEELQKMCVRACVWTCMWVICPHQSRKELPDWGQSNLHHSRLVQRKCMRTTKGHPIITITFKAALLQCTQSSGSVCIMGQSMNPAHGFMLEICQTSWCDWSPSHTSLQCLRYTGQCLVSL